MIVAFALGFVVVGAFDLLYTLAGGQSYSPALAPISISGWPLYVPIQMGIAGVVLLAGWSRLARSLPVALQREHGLDAVPSVVSSLVPLGIGLVLSFVLLHHELHASIFVALTMLSVLGLAIGASRLELVAFATVGLAGPAAEWLLLDPRLNYWHFTRADLFGRLPAWEPFVYGWIGVTIARINRSSGSSGRSG